MPLPWVRLDTNIATHDKMLSLLSDPSTKKWQASASYMFALGWSVGQETDGRVPTAALPFVHGTPQTARLLVKHKLWTERIDGYEIVNFAERQQTKKVTEALHEMQSLGARKGNCVRWHGPKCWDVKTGQCRGISRGGSDA